MVALAEFERRLRIKLHRWIPGASLRPDGELESILPFISGASQVMPCPVYLLVIPVETV